MHVEHLCLNVKNLKCKEYEEMEGVKISKSNLKFFLKNIISKYMTINE